LTVFAGLAALLCVLFVWPTAGPPRPADGILTLNGTDEQARESKAISLAEHGYAPVLLFSQGKSNTSCPTVPRIQVVCFVPSPGRTVGEVEWAARYARAHGWRSIIVVATRPQATRAEILMRRCFSGRVETASASVPLVQLPYDIGYESGALLRALLVDRHC
jgi:hypothetical protein